MIREGGLEALGDNLAKNWKNCLWQGAAAGFSITLLSIILRDVLNLILIASAGSTAFLVLALPHTRAAKPRNVIGGHSLCIIAGLFCSLVNVPGLEEGLAVALGFFLMVATDSEHPPAGGTALALAGSPAPAGAVFILLSAIFFSGLRLALLSKLENLTD